MPVLTTGTIMTHLECFLLHFPHQYCSIMMKSQKVKADKGSDAIKWAEEMGFSNIRILLLLLIIMPITSCEAERCFSRLKFVKSDLRNTMAHDR